MTNKKFKIAVVIPKYGLVGGGEKFALELTERIAQNPRYEIHVFANQWKIASDRFTFHKIPIITFPKFLTTISFSYFANRKISEMNFDLIHTHERIFYADIFTMHSIPHRIWVKDVRKKKIMSLFDYCTIWVERHLIKRAKKFVAVSSLTKEKFLEEYQVNPENVPVIHPGVDLDKFKNDDKAKRYEIRSHFGIDESDAVILFVGMNFEIKGLDILMRAIARTTSNQENNRLKLLVVGKGNEKKYKKLAYQLGITENVIFAGLRKDHIEHIYFACDIFAMLSKFDTFGMSVLEAMAAGLPVIISRNVGAKDLVSDSGNGFVVEQDNIEAVRSKISLLLNREKREYMANQARQTAIQYSWEAMAERMTDIYETFLTSPAGTPCL